METKIVDKPRRKSIVRQATLPLHIMLIPGIVLLLVFNYSTMIGVIIAFQWFDPVKTDGSLMSIFFGSPWAEPNGMGNFLLVVQNSAAYQAIINTVVISSYKIVTMFFAPITLSLLLNEVRKQAIKGSIQTILYLPHFISWVILAGIVMQLLSVTGVVNNLMADLHYSNPQALLTENGASIVVFKKIPFLLDPLMFQPIIIITNIWKEIGWSTIIYLAAISGVDPTLYEAAVMDGANKLKQMWHITLPGMKPIIILIMVLSLRGILDAGFDQIFNLYSASTYETGDIIDTFVYRIGIQNSQWALGAAVGLVKSVISLVLISISYSLAYKFANYEIF